MEISANGDPKCAQEAMDGGAGDSRDKRVGEVPREGLLCEWAVGVVEAWFESFVSFLDIQLDFNFGCM